jgi:hypothetical protein
MGVVTQDRTVICRTSCFPVPSGNPRIFEVHALEYKMWTEGCHLKRICPILFSLGVYVATEEHLKERGTSTSLNVMQLISNLAERSSLQKLKDTWFL